MGPTKKRQSKAQPKRRRLEKKVAVPSHRSSIPLLRKVQGQLGGIQDMIEEGRYCVDILVQCRAAMAALRNIELKIFHQHLTHCVEDAFYSQDKEGVRQKVEELTKLLLKRTQF